MMTETLHIGELARQLGTARSTVRYYEEIGLLPPASRSQNGYRVYNQTDVERLHFIQRARALDFSLGEIKEMLALRERGEAPCAYVVAQIGVKMTEVKRKIAALTRLKEELTQLQAQADRLPQPEIAAKSCVCHLIENRQLSEFTELELRS
jgi:DNA-binding transcriptional MerR regulator